MLETYTQIVSKIPGATFRVNKAEITPATLRGVKALIVMTPFTRPKEPASFSKTERAAIVEFVRKGRPNALATRFWGKDSVPFMQDVISWLLQ